MITEDLVIYIQGQIKKNVPEDLILSRLLQAGWHEDDARAGLAKVAETRAVTAPTVAAPSAITLNPAPKEKESQAPAVAAPYVKILDPYRELPEDDSLQQVLNKTEQVSLPTKREDPKVWSPKIQQAPVASQPLEVAAPEVLKADPKPVSPPATDFSRVQEIINQSSYRDTVANIDQAKPAAGPSVSQPGTPKVIEMVSSETSGPKPVSIESQSVTLAIPEKDKNPSEDEKLQVSISTLQNVSSSSFTSLPAFKKPVPAAPAAVPVTDQKANNIPIHINAPIASPVSPTPVFPPVQFSSDVKSAAPAPKPTLSNFTVNNTNLGRGQTAPVSKNPAMLSSFMQDVSSMQKPREEAVFIDKKKPKLLIIIILAVLLVGGGATFAFVKGYIKFPSVVKKDPKVSILNTPAALGTVPSYKADTSISISLPSFANITQGLVSGQAVSSVDTDTVSLTANGLVNHTGPNTLYDYGILFKSSIQDSEIVTNLKFDGSHYFIHIPDLAEILHENAPVQGIVSFTKGQTDLVIPELSPKWGSKIGNSSIYEVLSAGIPDYAKAIIASSFKEFVASADLTEKDAEDIKGISSYHYTVNADRQSAKKFLSSVSSIFTADLSDEYKKSLDEAFGAVVINSLEVWIGKEDNIVRQFKVSLSVPLSKVIGLDDKGIGDNKVQIDWQTSYYDFNTTDAMNMPENATSIEDFAKLIRDAKIKNKILLFSDSAKVLKNAEGSFGKKANPSGSCTAPTSGSLFSPLGHVKGASVAVASIAGAMNDTLALTDNAGSCYSTIKDWAVSFPLASNPETSYCIDSKGVSKITDIPLAGVSCEQ